MLSPVNSIFDDCTLPNICYATPSQWLTHYHEIYCYTLSTLHHSFLHQISQLYHAVPTVQLNYIFTHVWNPTHKTMHDFAWTAALWSVEKYFPRNNIHTNSSYISHIVATRKNHMLSWFSSALRCFMWNHELPSMQTAHDKYVLTRNPVVCMICSMEVL